MSLLSYFKKQTSASSQSHSQGTLTPKERKKVDECVKRVLESHDSRKRGSYNHYTAEERASIGKYASENGPTKAARHFTKVLRRNINESTARKLRTEYLKELKLVKERDTAGQVVALTTKCQGRPLLLGKELDGIVQEYIKGLRKNKAIVNTSIVMAVAEGVLLSKDPSKLGSNGGQIVITKAWAKSILGRMGYRKRKGTNAGKISLTHFEEVKEYFLADIKAEVLMNDIPDELIINWDQNPLHIIPTGDWTMHQAGEKIIPIANIDDKRQITAVLAVSLTGTYLSPQLIYQGKTERCHPQFNAVPDGWDIWHSTNHWSNEETMKRYITKVIVPFVQKKRKELILAESHPALVIYDL